MLNYWESLSLVQVPLIATDCDSGCNILIAPLSAPLSVLNYWESLSLVQRKI